MSFKIYEPIHFMFRNCNQVILCFKTFSDEKVGVILVGGANNDLKVCQNKLNSENITQKIVEKCIMVHKKLLLL